MEDIAATLPEEEATLPELDVPGRKRRGPKASGVSAAKAGAASTSAEITRKPRGEAGATSANAASAPEADATVGSTATPAPEASATPPKRKRGRPKTRTEPTAQVNVRMDASLKAAGDEGLARAGITPSEAVRALWEAAAEGGERLENALKALLERKDGLDYSLFDFDALFNGVALSIQAFLLEHHLSEDIHDIRMPTDDELEDIMYQDFLEEGAL